jgi:fructosamine-3-kinase
MMFVIIICTISSQHNFFLQTWKMMYSESRVEMQLRGAKGKKEKRKEKKDYVLFFFASQRISNENLGIRDFLFVEFSCTCV